MGKRAASCQAAKMIGAEGGSTPYEGVLLELVDGVLNLAELHIVVCLTSHAP